MAIFTTENMTGTDQSELGTQSQSYNSPPPAVDTDNLFACRIENPKSIIKILKSSLIRELAYFEVTARGIKVIIQDLGNFQATAYLPKELFRHYHCKENNVSFKINLKVVVECLQMFAGINETTVQWVLKKMGDPLCIMLEEMGYYTECNVKTLAMDVLVDFEFYAEKLLSRIICKSDCIKDAFQDLVSFHVGTLEIAVSIGPPFLAMRTTSDNVNSEVTVSKDSDFVENFFCKEDRVFRYRTALIKSALKPLAISEKTSIRIDERGVMALQFMLRNEHDIAAFVELFCMPEQESEDDI